MRKYLAPALCLLLAGLGAISVVAAEVTHPFEVDSYKKIVESHKGRPFVVVIWSLDCDYCQPSFQVLADSQRSRKLAVVTIATDRASDAEATHLIEKKIKMTGLVSDNWAFGSAPPKRLRFVIDQKWRGEMPRSYWFDEKGNVIAHSGVITEEGIRKWSRTN